MTANEMLNDFISRVRTAAYLNDLSPEATDEMIKAVKTGMDTVLLEGTEPGEPPTDEEYEDLATTLLAAMFGQLGN